MSSEAFDNVKDSAPQCVRNAVRPYMHALQRMSVNPISLIRKHNGKLPDFLVLGAQKAGTTSLFDMILHSPSVSAPRTKEIGFFDRYYKLGPVWYRRNFQAGPLLAGEGTPDYLYLDEARERIALHLPQTTKFVLVLRHPTKRLLSHYHHAVQRGYETLPLNEALAAEPDRIKSHGGKYAGNRIERRTYRSAYSYHDRGLYADQLRKWFAVFPKENFFIATTENMITEPQAVYGKVCRHLGIATPKLPEIPRKNAGIYKSSIDSALLANIDERYRESIADLEQLLGIKTNWLTEGRS